MVKLLIKGIFWVVTQLFNLIFSPVLSVVTSLFPSLATYFDYISSFTTTSLTYVRTCLSLLCINDTMILAIFDYFVICYTIYLTMLAVRFAVNIYNKFKI